MSFIVHRSLEAPALLKAASHFVKTLKVTPFCSVDSLAARLFTAIINLLLEVLSIAIRLTMMTRPGVDSISIQKDEAFNVLNTKIKEWNQAIMSRRFGSPNPLIFGGGLKRTGSWDKSQLEEFVDLTQEFKVHVHTNYCDTTIHCIFDCSVYVRLFAAHGYIHIYIYVSIKDAPIFESA